MARTSDPHAATVKAWQTRARSAGAGGVTQGRGDFARKIADDTRLPDGTLADERDGGSPPKPGEPFVVYRLGKSTTTELRGNAGNAEGVARHLSNIDDPEGFTMAGGTGDTIHAFRVVVHEDFGQYQGLSTARDAQGNYVTYPGATVGREAIGPRSGRVGPNDRTQVSYSFPTGAQFEATLIESVPLASVRDVLSRHPRADGRSNFDYTGSTVGADAIREAFKR